jgi:hypothetical protein
LAHSLIPENHFAVGTSRNNPCLVFDADDLPERGSVPSMNSRETRASISCFPLENLTALVSGEGHCTLEGVCATNMLMNDTVFELTFLLTNSTFSRNNIFASNGVKLSQTCTDRHEFIFTFPRSIKNFVGSSLECTK